MRRYATITMRVRIIADNETGVRAALASMRKLGHEFSSFTSTGIDMPEGNFAWQKVGRPTVTPVLKKRGKR